MPVSECLAAIARFATHRWRLTFGPPGAGPLPAAAGIPGSAARCAGANAQGGASGTDSPRSVPVSQRSPRTAGGSHVSNPVRALCRPQPGMADAIARAPCLSRRDRHAVARTAGGSHVGRPLRAAGPSVGRSRGGRNPGECDRASAVPVSPRSPRTAGAGWAGASGSHVSHSVAPVRALCRPQPGRADAIARAPCLSRRDRHAVARTAGGSHVGRPLRAAGPSVGRSRGGRNPGECDRARLPRAPYLSRRDRHAPLGRR